MDVLLSVGWFPVNLSYQLPPAFRYANIQERQKIILFYIQSELHLVLYPIQKPDKLLQKAFYQWCYIMFFITTV